MVCGLVGRYFDLAFGGLREVSRGLHVETLESAGSEKGSEGSGSHCDG